MHKKELARQKIVHIMQTTLDRMKEDFVRFEDFFDGYLSENKFTQSADAKSTLGKLAEFMRNTEETIRNPSDSNLERFVSDSAIFANYCEDMAK